MKYEAGQSLVHRLHPVVKLAWLLSLTVLVFVVDSVAIPLLAAGGIVGLLWVAGFPPWRMPGARVWLSMSVFILVIQAIFVREGDVLAWGVTTQGLVAGGRTAGRLLTVVLASALFVTTTDPVSLAYALMKAGLPYRWGFALVTSLRLAPAFRRQAQHIRDAQLVRGVAYDCRGPRRWWLILRHLCLPLLVSSLRTAHQLALSMEGRAFGLHRRRTYLREVSAGRRDVAAALALVLLIVLSSWYAVSR